MGNILGLIITIITIVVLIRLIQKKVSPVVIFLMLGLVLNIYLVIATDYTPMGEDTSGNHFLDIIMNIGAKFKSELNGAGANIMIVAGFATLMQYIGASTKLANTITKPLLKLNKPYVILALLYIVGTILKLMITSHTGLALLLMTTFYPVLIKLGVSRLSAASAVVLGGAIDWGVNDGAVIFGAETILDMPVAKYFMSYQFVPAAAAILTTAIVLGIVHQRRDKNITDEGYDVVHIEVDEALEEKVNALPSIYSILPALPLILVLLFQFIPNVKLDVFSANVIGIMVTILFELFSHKEEKLAIVADRLKVQFKAMGDSFANVVSLIASASYFSTALIALGGINVIADAITGLHGAQLITIIAFSILTFVGVMVLGSGNATWYAFAPLASDLATNVGLQPLQVAVPMQLGASIGRGLSPVAGAMIAVSGMAEVEIEDLIKVNVIPVVAGFIAMVLTSMVFL